MKILIVSGLMLKLGLMKKLLLLFFIAISVLNVNAQLLEPVVWNFKTEKISDSEYELVFEASIQESWHLYAQYLPPENYSLPTKFIFDSLIGVELIDTVVPYSKVYEEFEELTGAVSRFYKNAAVFKQKVRVVADVAYVQGAIDYMVCNDEP